MRLQILFLAGLLSLLPAIVRGDNVCYRYDTSVTNIPTTFAAAGGVSVVAPLSFVSTFMMVNGSTKEVAVNCSHSASSGLVPPAPSETSNRNIFVEAGESWAPPSGTGFGNVCHLRSNSSAITSGLIRLCLIGTPRAFP